jgi:diguanylate cyclase (GGDEF)-like protein
MTTTSLGTRLAWLAAAVGAVIALDSTPLLSQDAAIVVDDAAQFAAGLLAAGACWWTAQRAVGGQRTWRLLMAAGMVGWSIGQAIWSWYQIVADTPLPCPSLADVGYLTMPVMALPALLALAGGRTRFAGEGQRHGSEVYFLDGVVVVGSLFVITWATSLGTVVHAVAPTAPAFVTAVAYPATDLILVVIVGLLAVTRRVPEQYGTQLALLGCGLVAISVSDSIFAYIISSGGDTMPPVTNAGFIAGPLLIAVAAVTGVDERRGAHIRRAPHRTELAHLLLPLGLVAVTAGLVITQVVMGWRIDAVEAVTVGVVLAVVLVRQAITSVQNAALVDRLSAAQAALSHRAHHDPLTGLANRTLFGERLRTAVDRHRVHDRAFALLVIDLDDFKAVNDRLGHTAGDLVLRAVGERLCACVRSTDTVARLGGDEFAVLLDGASLPAALVGQRILAALGHPFVFEGWRVTLGASLGVVESGDEPALTPDLLLRWADGAMYVGKRRGKGVAVRYRADLGDELPPLARSGAAVPPPVPPPPPPPPAATPAASGQPLGGSTP